MSGSRAICSLTLCVTGVLIPLRMPCHPIETLAAVFTAIGTVAVAILAIWGDQVKDYLKGPRLELSLVTPKGDLTVRANGHKVYYFHVRVENRPGRNAATGVRVLLRGISRRTPSGQFLKESQVYPIQLIWTPMEIGEVERTVLHDSICDFGFVGQHDLYFIPAVVLMPGNFRGIVQKDECVRFEIVAVGQNVFSLLPAVFEVSWDGRWTENQEEFQRHLVIRKVQSLQSDS